jgi:bis(5'-adenosyl)-triphosphatase
MAESVFTTNPDVQARIIIQNSLAFAFPTNIPIVPGHVVICPKRVVQTIYELNAGEFAAMMDIMSQLHAALQKTFGATGFNYAWNEGNMAGQSVPHVHIHMLPRKEGDTGITEYDPRQFLYRPGSRAESPEEELRQVSGTIREAL